MARAALLARLLCLLPLTATSLQGLQTQSLALQAQTPVQSLAQSEALSEAQAEALSEAQAEAQSEAPSQAQSEAQAEALSEAPSQALSEALQASATRAWSGHWGAPAWKASSLDLSKTCSTGQCTPDMLPLMLRLLSPDVPPDCREPPSLQDLARPIVDVVREKAPADGACHFNYFPWCSAARRAGDYVPAAFAVAAVHAVVAPVEYDLGEFKTAPGVLPLGAKLCWDNGFLDLKEELLWNFTALDRAAEERCEELRQLVPEWRTLSMAAMNWFADHEGLWGPPGSFVPEVATKEEMLRHEVWKCNMGHHVLACDMAECMYNYCKLPDGRVGSGKQCRSDWLDPAVVAKHSSIYTGHPL